MANKYYQNDGDVNRFLDDIQYRFGNNNFFGLLNKTSL